MTPEYKHLKPCEPSTHDDVRVACYRCGRWRMISTMVYQQEGKPYTAYFCTDKHDLTQIPSCAEIVDYEISRQETR